MFPELPSASPPTRVLRRAGRRSPSPRPLIDALRDGARPTGRPAHETDAARDARFTALDLAVELRDFLDEHLAIEDADVLPMFQRHFSVRGVRRARAAGAARRSRSARRCSRRRGTWRPSTPRPPPRRSARRRCALQIVYRLARRSYARLVAKRLRRAAVIRISLRDLQWRRRRFVIVVLVASLAFGLALVMTGVTNQLSNEGTNTVALFGADQWVVAEGVNGPFTSSQLIDEGLSGGSLRSPVSTPRARSSWVAR